MGGRNRKKQKRRHGGPRDLETKVMESGGRTGFGLDADTDVNNSSSETAVSRARCGESRSTARQSRPTSVNVVAHTGHIVCAISENLAKETCVASLDASAPIHLQVAKQGNGQTYAETLAYLDLLSPHEILLNEGRVGSPLARKILELSSGFLNEPIAGESIDKDGPGASKTIVKFISRAYFDQNKGAVLLARLAREGTYDASVVCEYILLSSAHAVLHYTQQHLGGTLAKKSLDLLVISGGNSKMVIDRLTVRQLELLANAKWGKTHCSLMATIDYTKTSVGNRLLRTNLMSPPTRIDTITSRLDLVDALLVNEDFFYSVLHTLEGLPCLDQMLSNVALVRPKRTKNKTAASDGWGGAEVTRKVARKAISALVGIKTTLTLLPAFTRDLTERLIELASKRDIMPVQHHDQADNASTLKSSLLLGLGGGPESTASEIQEHHLLRAIILAMKNPALTYILDAVSAILTDSATSAPGNSNRMVHEECYALQADKTTMMYVVRARYKENVDNIYQLADDYTAKHGFYISVRYSSSRGYYLAVPEGTALPPDFIHLSKSRRFMACTTEEVVSLNIRAHDNVQDLLIMTDSKIQEVLDVARTEYDALAALSDAIALLDLCHSFADCVTQKSNQPWCRPMLGLEEEEEEVHVGHISCKSAVLIKNGRYIIQVSNSLTATRDGSQECVANDTYSTKAKPFTVLTGINGSGKSMYLKQIAIIVILAQCGGYVPAEFATIPILDRLCTRIGNTDDPEHNISTFMQEMKETAFICRRATPKSLLLIDELGRATSNEDGVALAWAVSESLLQSGALTFFVTHYPQVSLLGHETMYNGLAQNQHMVATVGTQEGEGGEISYTHKVGAGPCTVATAYGLDLACACGWPVGVLGEARTYESQLLAVAGDTHLDPEQLRATPTTTLACLSVESLIPKLHAMMKTNGQLDMLAARKSLQLIKTLYEDSSHFQQNPVVCTNMDDEALGQNREDAGDRRLNQSSRTQTCPSACSEYSVQLDA